MIFPSTYGTDAVLTKEQITSLIRESVTVSLEYPNSKGDMVPRTVSIGVDDFVQSESFGNVVTFPEGSRFEDASTYEVNLTRIGYKRLVAGKQVYLSLNSRLSLWIKPEDRIK